MQELLEYKNFEELANDWFTETKTNIKISSVGAYSRLLKTHLTPYFGEMKFNNITPEKIEDFLIYEQEIGFNNRHISNVLTLLRMITRYIFEKHSCFNPAACIKTPKYSGKNSRNEYSDKEHKEVLKILFTDIDSTKAAALLVLHTGLHVGELCALKWENIDLDAGMVRIENTLQRITLEGGVKVYLMELDESKKRTVPITNYLCEILKEYQAAPYTFFLSETRKPVEPRTVQYRLAALFKGTELKITFAKLREMFMDKCFDMGIDLAAISKLSGKKTFEIDTRKNLKNSPNSIIRAVVMVGSEQ